MSKVPGQLYEVTDSLPETFSRFRVCTSLRISCGSTVFGRPVTCMCEIGNDAVYRMNKEIMHPNQTETYRKNEVRL